MRLAQQLSGPDTPRTLLCLLTGLHVRYSTGVIATPVHDGRLDRPLPHHNPNAQGASMKLPHLFNCFLLALLPTQAFAQAPVASVPAVDLARYGGKWFEIASFPMFFQRNCVADTTAEYAPAKNGALSVLNRCRTESGFDEASGTASVVDGFGNSRFKVSFFWPFEADYWIIGLDPEYRWAVVGDPDRRTLWVLSRTPQLAAAETATALASAGDQGFDLTRLRFTSQAPARAILP